MNVKQIEQNEFFMNVGLCVIPLCAIFVGPVKVNFSVTILHHLVNHDIIVSIFEINFVT